jgi:hypothetical protein
MIMSIVAKNSMLRDRRGTRLPNISYRLFSASMRESVDPPQWRSVVNLQLLGGVSLEEAHLRLRQFPKPSQRPC